MKKVYFIFLLLISSVLLGAQKPKVLVGSPVRQKPAILKEFLASLDRLDRTSFELDYVFVDDNDLQESKQILKTFSKRKQNKCHIFPPNIPSSSEFVCDENTHHWEDDNIWRVASFKDRMIQFAKEHDYDYLFLIDSDIVLHPNTVKHLISCNKEIVSEIFWTKFFAQSIPYPQVWLYDEYTQIENPSNKPLTQEERNKLLFEFFNKLKKPGIYEVGGLGACTLVSKSAIQKGACFRKIPNLTFCGEDRHFCIRAGALGIGLFVDTHYPAYHIYRESELEGVSAYKRQCEQNRPRLTLGMCIKNEADRYLKQVLEKASRYITDAVIIDDASTDRSVEVCKKALKNVPHRIIQNSESKFSNEVVLRKQLWQEITKTNPDWILILDADELFEDRIENEIADMLKSQDVDVYCFRLYDFWNSTKYREDEWWNAHKDFSPFMVRYRPEFCYQWKETPQHCGRFPQTIYQFEKTFHPLRLKHLGWSRPEWREQKYQRYKQLDPNGTWGSKQQYESILDENPHLVQWVE